MYVFCVRVFGKVVPFVLLNWFSLGATFSTASICFFFPSNPVLPKITTLYSSLSQTIMRDRWMNVGFDDDDLKPYQEPPKDLNDPVRIGIPYPYRVPSLVFSFLVSCLSSSLL